MTEFDNRKQAAPPRGYKAVYGQNGITYHRLPSSQPAAGFPWAFVLAVVVLAVVALAVAHLTGNLVLFEDGSFRLFSFAGCLPLQPCQ